MQERAGTVLRHAITILAGGAGLWFVQWISMPIIALIPGFEAKVIEWVALVPPNPSELGRLAASILIAGLMELLRQKDKSGRATTFGFAMMMLFVTISARSDVTPDHLRILLGVWALFRFAGIYAAAGAAAVVRQLLRVAAPEEETVAA